MSDFPRSPDEVIDPRWNSYLHARNPSQPAHHGGSPVRARELNAEIRSILAPWQAGDRGPRETLEALRDLADRAL